MKKMKFVKIFTLATSAGIMIPMVFHSLSSTNSNNLYKISNYGSSENKNTPNVIGYESYYNPTDDRFELWIELERKYNPSGDILKMKLSDLADDQFIELKGSDIVINDNVTKIVSIDGNELVKGKKYDFRIIDKNDPSKWTELNNMQVPSDKVNVEFNVGYKRSFDKIYFSEDSELIINSNGNKEITYDKFKIEVSGKDPKDNGNNNVLISEEKQITPNTSPIKIEWQDVDIASNWMFEKGIRPNLEYEIKYYLHNKTSGYEEVKTDTAKTAPFPRPKYSPSTLSVFSRKPGFIYLNYNYKNPSHFSGNGDFINDGSWTPKDFEIIDNNKQKIYENYLFEKLIFSLHGCDDDGNLTGKVDEIIVSVDSINQIVDQNIIVSPSFLIPPGDTSKHRIIVDEIGPEIPIKYNKNYKIVIDYESKYDFNSEEAILYTNPEENHYSLESNKFSLSSSFEEKEQIPGWFTQNLNNPSGLYIKDNLQPYFSNVEWTGNDINKDNANDKNNGLPGAEDEDQDQYYSNPPIIKNNGEKSIDMGADSNEVVGFDSYKIDFKGLYQVNRFSERRFVSNQYYSEKILKNYWANEITLGIYDKNENKVSNEYTGNIKPPKNIPSSIAKPGDTDGPASDEHVEWFNWINKNRFVDFNDSKDITWGTNAPKLENGKSVFLFEDLEPNKDYTFKAKFSSIETNDIVDIPFYQKSFKTSAVDEPKVKLTSKDIGSRNAKFEMEIINPSDTLPNGVTKYDIDEIEFFLESDEDTTINWSYKKSITDGTATLIEDIDIDDPDKRILQPNTNYKIYAKYKTGYKLFDNDRKFMTEFKTEEIQDEDKVSYDETGRNISGHSIDIDFKIQQAKDKFYQAEKVRVDLFEKKTGKWMSDLYKEYNYPADDFDNLQYKTGDWILEENTEYVIKISYIDFGNDYNGISAKPDVGDINLDGWKEIYSDDSIKTGEFEKPSPKIDINNNFDDPDIKIEIAQLNSQKTQLEEIKLHIEDENGKTLNSSDNQQTFTSPDSLVFSYNKNTVGFEKLTSNTEYSIVIEYKYKGDGKGYDRNKPIIKKFRTEYWDMMDKTPLIKRTSSSISAEFDMFILDKPTTNSYSNKKIINFDSAKLIIKSNGKEIGSDEVKLDDFRNDGTTNKINTIKLKVSKLEMNTEYEVELIVNNQTMKLESDVVETLWKTPWWYYATSAGVIMAIAGLFVLLKFHGKNKKIRKTLVNKYDELLEQLREKLMPYAIPREFEKYDELEKKSIQELKEYLKKEKIEFNSNLNKIGLLSLASGFSIEEIEEYKASKELEIKENEKTVEMKLTEVQEELNIKRKNQKKEIKNSESKNIINNNEEKVENIKTKNDLEQEEETQFDNENEEIVDGLESENEVVDDLDNNSYDENVEEEEY